ncbi:helix-turn-helix domain-containing protein [Serratia symbiotica]|uniref:helix-turn-helix domain-containing protein n=1 Tax=Serratia symbiotica TaxID=138074 RepID=UPI001CF08B75|nr:helix-turn-helix transcriptional regulator [Serratia symbiotica]
MPSNISKRLCEALAARAMSQAELARRVGVGNGYVSKLISGEIVQPKKNLSAICKALNIREVWLLSGKGDANLEPSINGTNLPVFDIDENNNLNYIYDMDIENIRISSESDACVINVRGNNLLGNCHVVIDKRGVGTGFFLIKYNNIITISSRFDLLNKITWIHNTIEILGENDFHVIGKVINIYSLDGDRNDEI